MRLSRVVEREFLLRQVALGGAVHRFRIYLPPLYDDEVASPAVLFLHGAGERGTDTLGPTRVGLGHTLSDRPNPYPAIVVFPQCPKETHWSSATAQEIAIAALDATVKEFNVDRQRIALTGISMGAAGAWLTAADHPKRFMSLAPICGWVSARSDRDRWKLIGSLREIPTWIFHGGDDTIVPVDASRAMAASLLNAGADVRYTELPGVGHNCWDIAYGESELLEWLLEPTLVPSDVLKKT